MLNNCTMNDIESRIQGFYTRSVDSKNRIRMPSQYIAGLTACINDPVLIVDVPKKFLIVKDFNSAVQDYKNEFNEASTLDAQRIVSSLSFPIRLLDENFSRFIVQQECLSKIDIPKYSEEKKRDVVIAGCYDRIEIYSPSTWNEVTSKLSL